MICCQLNNSFITINKEYSLFNFLKLSVLIFHPKNDIAKYSQKLYLKYSNDLLVGLTLVSKTTVKMI